MRVLGARNIGMFVFKGDFAAETESGPRLGGSPHSSSGPRAARGLWVEHYESLGEEVHRRLPLRRVFFPAQGE